MEKPIRAAVVGAGIISIGHIEGYRQAGAELAAIVDPVEAARERARTEYGFSQGLADYHELLDMDIDIVSLCTPNLYHCPAAVDLLRAGKAVICEKPMARTAEECDAMIRASRESGNPLYIAHSQRFSPQHQFLVEQVRQGAIGRPFLAQATFIGNEFARMNDPNNWKCTWDVSGGGVLIDNGAHMIQLLEAMFGPAEYVEATALRSVVTAENKADDTTVLQIGYHSGVLASMTLTFAARFSAWPDGYGGAALRTDVYGTEGAISATNGRPNVSLSVAGKPMVHLSGEEIPVTVAVSTVAYFVDCLRTGKTPLVTMEDGRETVAVAQAGYRSSQLGRRVYLSEIG